MTTVYVCPERDIECGRYPASWCATCPQRPPTGCSTCDIVGIHACPGGPIVPMSPESKSELVAILAEYPPVLTGAGIAPKTPMVGTYQDTEMLRTNRERAFLEIQRVLADPDQDGVLAKIRNIIAETK